MLKLSLAANCSKTYKQCTARTLLLYCWVSSFLFHFISFHSSDYIRPPKPSRFQRAMKQIYRPSFVLSHFVHYSNVTKAMDESYNDLIDDLREPKMNRHHRRNRKKEPLHEMFMNELSQGALVHARSVLPHDTRRHSAECSIGSKVGCMMGYLCGDDVKYVDKLHQDNVFRNSDGRYCNCWRNKVIDEVLVPKLESLLSST